MILDLFSRRIVGWAMGKTLERSLVLSALDMGLTARQPNAGLLCHSDRGSQYASSEYQQALQEAGIVCSMSRKGNCWDNAVVESFFSTLEFECARSEIFSSRAAARREVLQYILGFYNPIRLHSTLGYVSPMEYELAA